MRITKTTPIDDDKLSADLMESLSPDESLIAHCESIQEFNNARQNAYTVRRDRPRPDGNVYAISTSGISSTVTVKVVEAKS